MNVAQVIGDLRIGGAERLFVDLANSLDPRKTFVVLLNETPVEQDLRQNLDPSIPVHVSPVRKRSAVIDLPRLSGLFRRLRCDVVHTHMFWSNLYGSIGGAMARVPAVITSEHGRNEWKRPWHRWIESGIVSRIADKRLCVSQDILQRRRDVDGIPEDKLVLVPNGTRLPRKIDRRPGDPFTVGSVGRLVKEKDYPTLVRAVALLARSGLDCRLEIVGDGPARKDIDMAVEAAGIGDRVCLAGIRHDVESWLRRWTVFASSSVQEGQPIALLEAMAHGLPCVATQVGGVPDTIRHGTEGILVPPGDAEALAEALAKLAGDRATQAALGDAARARVVRDFSIDSLAARCLDIYRAAIVR